MDRSWLEPGQPASQMETLTITLFLCPIKKETSEQSKNEGNKLVRKQARKKKRTKRRKIAKEGGRDES